MASSQDDWSEEFPNRDRIIILQAQLFENDSKKGCLHGL
jgi:hypothetical protein